VDPSAILLLNDNTDEQIGFAQSEYLFKFASGLKAKGIPIDGVGFQLHNYIEPEGTLRFYIPLTYPDQFSDEGMDTYLKNVDLNVKRYASVGLKVAFTEVDGYIKIGDLDLTTAAGRLEYEKRLQWQAKYYVGLLKIAVDNDNVILYHTWGVTDRYPDAISDMFSGYGDMHLFDKNLNPKPAYYQMLDLLKNPPI
jgi:endo-1,4-beta-xylanase